MMIDTAILPDIIADTSCAPQGHVGTPMADGAAIGSRIGRSLMVDPSIGYVSFTTIFQKNPACSFCASCSQSRDLINVPALPITAATSSVCESQAHVAPPRNMPSSVLDRISGLV